MWRRWDEERGDDVDLTVHWLGMWRALVKMSLDFVEKARKSPKVEKTGELSRRMCVRELQPTRSHCRPISDAELGITESRSREG